MEDAAVFLKGRHGSKLKKSQKMKLRRKEAKDSEDGSR